MLRIIDNSKAPYPLLHFQDTDYFPLTWHYVVEELGWRYSFDAENGLVIKSKTDLEINGKSRYYAMKDDVAVGYPDNTFEKYIFTVKKGDSEEKEFDLEAQLQGYDYYFNKQRDENGYMSYKLSPGPIIEGDILLLPSVRQHDGKDENVMIKIDFAQGKIISITEIEEGVN